MVIVMAMAPIMQISTEAHDARKKDGSRSGEHNLTTDFYVDYDI